MILSFLYPGHYQKVDGFRLSIQSSVIDELWCLGIGRDKELSIKVKNELVSEASNLNPASLIFISNSSCLGELFIEGKWKHLAIYLGSRNQIEKKFGVGSKVANKLERYYAHGNEILILDSSSDGVRVRKVSQLFKPNLKAISTYELNLEDAQLEKFILSSLSYLGKSYDYDLLTFNNSSLYCSELVYYSLEQIGICISVEDVFINRKYISPSSIANFLIDSDLSDNVSIYMVLDSPEKQMVKYVDNNLH